MAIPKFRPQTHQFMARAAAVSTTPLFYFVAINPEMWTLKHVRLELLTALKKLGRLGKRLYNNTVHTWDEKPIFDFSKTLKMSGGGDIAITIFATPKPMGGGGRRAGAGRGEHNISDIFRWIDWGTKKITRKPKMVPGTSKYSPVGRTKTIVKKGRGPAMIIYGPAPTVVDYLQFNYPFTAKTLTGAIASFKGSRGDLVAKVKEAKSGIKGRRFTLIIRDFLQYRIGPEVEAALLKAINKGIK